MGAFSMTAQAAEFPYNGQVQPATGALAAFITPIPQDILGSITFDDTAIASGSAGAADVVGLQVNIGTVGGSFVPTAPSVLGPFDANKVPAMPIHGLIITSLGLLLVAGRRLRKTPTRR
jgi:hypothetical protein